MTHNLYNVIWTGKSSNKRFFFNLANLKTISNIFKNCVIYEKAAKSTFSGNNVLSAMTNLDIYGHK